MVTLLVAYISGYILKNLRFSDVPFVVAQSDQRLCGSLSR